MTSRPKSLAIRLCLPLALIGLTAVAGAAPAHAEEVAERPEVAIVVPERVVTADKGSKTVPFEVVNTGKTPATGLVVEYATAGTPVDPRIGFLPPEGCTATGCTVGDLAPGARKQYTFTVTPTAELPRTGLSFGLSVHDAGNEWQESATVTVVRTELGVDLEVARIPQIKLAAGKSAVLPVQVRNNGNKPTEGVAIALTGPRYITFPNDYSNCVDIDEALDGIVCAFDLTLQPGDLFTMAPSTPLTVVADAIAPGPADYRGTMHAFGLDDATDDAGLAAATRAAKKPGSRLELVPAAQGLAVDGSELNEWDNKTAIPVKVALNPADSVAIGDTFTGKVGDTRTVEVGFRNDGPATVLGPSVKWAQSAKVRMPSGLALTKVDKRCFPNGAGEPNWNMPGRISGHHYLCVATKAQAAGGRELFSFSGKIQNGRNEDKGTVTVLGGVQDLKAGNNTAKIEVKLTASTATSTGSGSGGSGGGLAITGAPAGRTAGAGLLLVLTGALALVLTRRRPAA